MSLTGRTGNHKSSWNRGTIRPRTWLTFALLCALFTPTALRAEEIHWRRSYAEARKEAQEKSRPLLIDFGTESCFWCKKLDALTFRDPTIIKLLNEQFVALKVDAEKQPSLTQALRIQSYPTIVLAAADGKILGTIEGFLETSRMLENLRRVLASQQNPEWMIRDYEDASKAIGAGDYARAIAMLKSILEDGQERPTQLKARQVLQDLEQQAAGRLARARQLDDKGQTTDAVNNLSDLMKSFAGTHAAEEASQYLTTLAARPEVKAPLRKRRAQELLAQAREDYRTQQYAICLDRCEVLASGYADLPEGTEGIQLAAEIKNNPVWLQEACNSLSERLSNMYLALADTWIKKGQPQQAAMCLERIQQTFPGSRYAEIAQMRLTALQGRPTLRADFKK